VARRRGGQRLGVRENSYRNSRPCSLARREPSQAARGELEKNEGRMNKETGIRMSFSEELQPAKIKVIGVGGCGSNPVNRMIRAKVEGVEFINANTDLQALQMSQAPTKLHVCVKMTKGPRARDDPEVDTKAA